MTNYLLTEEQLADQDEGLADYLSKDKSVRWADIDHSVRQAYGRYACFANRDLQTRMGWGELTALDSFYNAYFWMVVFSRRYQACYGSDAGIEQQVFKVLETAPSGVDWKVVEEIAKTAQE